MISVVTGVLSPRWFRSPLVRLWKRPEQRQKIAEILQVVQQLVWHKDLELTPRVALSPPLTVEDLSEGATHAGYLPARHHRPGAADAGGAGGSQPGATTLSPSDDAHQPSAGLLRNREALPPGRDGRREDRGAAGDDERRAQAQGHRPPARRPAPQAGKAEGRGAESQGGRQNAIPPSASPRRGRGRR